VLLHDQKKEAATDHRFNTHNRRVNEQFRQWKPFVMGHNNKSGKTTEVKTQLNVFSPSTLLDTSGHQTNTTII